MAPLTFHLIPHTHWDREWYLTRAGFQARLIPVIDQVLDQLERDPDARFVLDGQTVLLDDYLAVKPGSESRIRAQVRRGALEIGPWYVLSDLLIPSAESLRRNLEEGRRDAARFGRRLEVLYSPDAFGHPAELPRLATEAGLTRAVIRRGLGRPHRTDRDLYRWEAPGGEAVLVYHLPAAGYDIAIDLAGAGDGLTQRWAPVRRALTARAASRQIAVFLGADHHAMVASVTELRHRLQALEGGHLVRVSGLTEYFDAVEAERPALTTIKGELRRTDGHAWVLQDVHSARSRLKRHHALVEGFLEGVAAPLAGLALRKSGTDRSAFLAEAWRLLLQSQFHDTLAGTTSDAVQEAQRVRLGEVAAIARHIAVASLHDLAGHDPDRASERSAPFPSRLLCWNPSEEMRSGEIVTAELTFFRRDVLVGQLGGRTPRTGTGYRPFALATETGRVLPVQVLAVRKDQERRDFARHYPDQDEVDRIWAAFRVPAIPGLQVASLTPVPSSLTSESGGLEIGDGILSNRFVSVAVSAAGTLEITDRRTGERYAGLGALIDEPDRGDLYTYSRGPGAAVRGGKAGKPAVLAQGPLVAALESSWTMRSAGAGWIGVRLVVVLQADSPVVQLRFDLEHQAADHRLRAHFPVGAGTSAVAGTAFGAAVREPVNGDAPRGSIEHPSRTAPAHGFVAAAEGRRGLAILSTGCFEYEWTRNRALAVTLIRAVGRLSRNDLPERPGHAAWPEAVPDAQEPGRHVIELGLVPVTGADVARPGVHPWMRLRPRVQTLFLRGDS